MMVNGLHVDAPVPVRRSIVQWGYSEELVCLSNIAALVACTSAEPVSHRACIAACRGDFVVVGDLMKSITLLVYKSAEGSLEVRHGGSQSMWRLIGQHQPTATF